MNHKLIIVPLLCLALQANALAQTETTVKDAQFKPRVSVGADWKIVKGLHMEAEYELRMAGNMSGISRHQLNLGVKYSPVSFLDVGCGYCFLGNIDNDGSFEPEHRIYADLAFSYKFGAWKLSLKEKVQMTHKSYEFNAYQQTPNLVELKSRLKLSYKGFARIEPYAFGELRNCFNGPSFSAEYNEATGKYTEYEFLGYSDTYINRIRGGLGMKWNIDRSNSIDVSAFTDFCRNKKIDTNAEGTKLKSFVWEKSTDIILSIGYVFSF